MEPFLATATTAAISAIVGALVSALVVWPLKAASRKAVEKDASERAAERAMQTGMRALLWRELQTLYDTAEAQDGLTISQRRHVENCYAAYHELGGNDTGIVLGTFDGADAQKWAPVWAGWDSERGKSCYYLVNLKSGMMLDVDGGGR